VLMDHIVEGYEKLLEWRDRADSICAGVPIIAHTYDHATPVNVPAQFLTITRGPWLYPVFTNAQIPETDFIAASDYLLDRLGNTLLGLNLPNVHVVKTTGTLIRAALGATGASNDWLNEIHPTHAGYKKIAPLVGEKIQELLNP
jgi:lysophospholipase L1-like esterase